jgi:sugar (pentulose or hexulose) kinase
MQNKADVVGRPIEIPAVEEATPLGAAILAGIGVGCYANEQQACERTYKPGEVLEPDPKRNAEYQKRYELFRQIYPALKDLHHQIGG